MKKQSGFTLIELLVVIAIIGILATIVLASLNTARNKANNVAIKSDMDNARAAAELFYDNSNQLYTGVCTATGSVNPAGINTILAAAANLTTSTVVLTAVPQTTATVNCHDAALTWVAQAPLKIAEGANVYWCVDNTGKSVGEAAALAGAATACV